MTSTEVALRSGVRVPVPFRCDRAEAILLLGDGELLASAALLAGTGLQPLRTRAGRAVLSLWLMDYDATCVGPYHELVLTVMASEQAVEIDDAPYAFGAVMLDPRLRVYIASLLLPSAATVAIDYGRELLHLDKRAVDDIVISDDAGDARTIHVYDGGQELLRAHLGASGLGAQVIGSLALVGRVGLGRVIAAAKPLSVLGVAPPAMGGGTIETKLVGVPTLRPFGPRDVLAVHAGRLPLLDQLRETQFRPKLVSRTRRMGFTMQRRGAG